VPVYLGLDCGGSSCRALALDDGDEPIFLAQGGSANLLSTRPQTLHRSLERALQGVPQVDVVCACFAGLINAEQRDRAHDLVREFLPTAKIFVEPDYAAALRACVPGTEICVIAGTGSIVCSRQNGRLRKSGGGGWLLGDEGSGFRYGRRALLAYLRDPDKVSKRTREAVFKIFQATDPAEVTAKVYQSPAPGALVASMAASLFRDADTRYAYAVEGIAQETEALVSVVMDHIRRFPPETLAFGLAGSVWKKAMVRDSFIATLRDKVGREITVAKSEIPPVRGAALLARDYFNGEVNQEI